MQQNNRITPIADFVKQYAESDTTRFHMPGHKGKTFLGCESFDITEICGADSLYEAEGIIAESEKKAAELFGSAATFYSTEGSSQCIRAMLYLALMNNKSKKRGKPVIVAARNVHKAFVYAASLLDFEVVWLWPEDGIQSLCSCHISVKCLEDTLKSISGNVAAVYITSPDYLGGLSDIEAVADVCHKNNTLLLVDNAHGAYLHFLDEPMHPLDLGADICCDSAHKTFPVLTGGAYLHISKYIPDDLIRQAKHALSLFGSTSPSYLILTSLDLCNEYLQNGYYKRLAEVINEIEHVRQILKLAGWQIEETDPLRITFRMPANLSGNMMAGQLRKSGIECEYADNEFLVLMITPENTKEDFVKLIDAVGRNLLPYTEPQTLAMAKSIQEMSIREAMFSKSESISVRNANGRICRTPTVSCPPAIPVAVPGERIAENAIKLFLHYGIEFVDVVK